MNAIGIDIGGTHTRMARVSEDGRIQVHRSFATVRDPRALLNALIGETAKLRDEYTTAIGIGIPGRVDGRTGKILSGGFVDLSVLPLADELNRASELPVFTDNDANMALAAEARFGAARSLADAVMLTIGTGIGGAILSGGRVFHGGGLAG
ncbi:MAG: ROK family protein, partial [Aestuariivirga sp.]